MRGQLWCEPLVDESAHTPPPPQRPLQHAPHVLIQPAAVRHLPKPTRPAQRCVHHKAFTFRKSLAFARWLQSVSIVCSLVDPERTTELTSTLDVPGRADPAPLA